MGTISDKMAQDIICRPILLRDIASQDFCFGVVFAFITEYISSNLKLRQRKNLGIAISLSEIGLQIISWAILSEIVPTYYILLVYTSNYILLYFFRSFWSKRYIPL